LVALLAAPAVSAAEPQAKWGPLEVAHQRIAVGEKQKFRLLPERTFEGSFLDMPIFAARGARPGGCGRRTATCPTAAI
jgi:hypothetical protein